MCSPTPRPRSKRIGWLFPLLLLLTFVLPAPVLAAGVQAAATATTGLASAITTATTSIGSRGDALPVSTATGTTTRTTTVGTTTATTRQRAHAGHHAAAAPLVASPAGGGPGVLPGDPLLTYPLTDRLQVIVNLATGNVIVHATDLVVRGTGLDLVVDRWYNNVLAATQIVDGSFAVGWMVNAGPDVQLKNPGSSPTFIGPSNYAVGFTPNPDGSFSAQGGIDATLVHTGDGAYTLTFQASGERYHFTSGGVLTARSDRNGNALTYTYGNPNDPNASPTSLAAITDTQGRAVHFLYNAMGYLGTMTDASGRQAQYRTDGYYLLSSTDLAGKQTQYGYDGFDDLARITDAAGHVTQLGYNDTAQITALTLGAGSPVAGTYTFTYTTGSTVVTDPNNHQTTYTLDSQGRATQVTDALGNHQSVTWTSDNHLQTATDAYGKVTQYGYDANNNPTAVTLPTGASSSAVYGPVANIPYYYVPTSSTDAQGNTVTMGYDGNGNLTTVTNQLPSQNQTQYFYNANGTVDHVIDARGNTTAYAYDNKGNLTKITPPSFTPGPGSQALGPTVIVPDALSRPSTVTDGNGHQATYTYDPLDRVTKVQYPDAAVSAIFDADGNQTSMTDSSGTTSFSYDARNRQTQKVLPAGGGTFSYAFDPASNLTSYQDAGGTVGYAYNAGDQLTTLTEPGGAQTAFGSNQNGQRTSTSYPDGVTMTQTYDASGRLATIKAVNPSTTLANYSYSYTNPATSKDTGLAYTISENDAPGVGPFPTRNFTTTQTYDQTNRQLSWVVKQAGGATVHDYAYQYDGLGNRTQIIADAMVQTPPPNPKTVLTYNPVNELLTTSIYATGASQPTSTATWTWDGTGNLTGNSGYPGISNPATLTYNQHNQTTSITDVYQHPVTMTYAGAGQGERTSADWSNNPGGPTPEYGHTSYTNAALGTMSRTDTTGTTYYTVDPSGLPVSERTPSGTYYYVYDGQGDVVMLVDPPNGAPVAIMSPCPTKNQSGDQWNAPGTTALYEAIRQGNGASGAITDLGTGNLLSKGQFVGTSGTGPTRLFDDPGVCDPFNCEPLSPAIGDPSEIGPGGAGLGPSPLPGQAIPLPPFSETTIEEVIASADAPYNAYITNGARALAKKVGRGDAAYAGIAPTTANADAIIRDVLANPVRDFFGTIKYDVYNAQGQGVRVFNGTNAFGTFLNSDQATR